MGSSKSKPAPPPSPLFDEPWRRINWGSDKQRDLQYVKNYKPQAEGQQLRILLHGPVGAGKSSFINSICSVLKERMCHEALVDNSFRGCCTKKYTTYKIEKGGSNTFYPFVLNDMMGLKLCNRKNGRIHVKDVRRLLKGHVKDGYVFNPEYKLSKDNVFYNKCPTPNDKVHVLVSVIDANTTDMMSKEAVEILQDIRDEAGELGIPHVAIFTKIDKACPETKQNIQDVYRSKPLKKKMEKFSADVGIPMNCIFPVQNYHEETSPNNDTDALILNALSHILNFGNDFINKK